MSELPPGFTPPIYEIERVTLLLWVASAVVFSVVFVYSLCVDGGDFFFGLFGAMAWIAIVKHIQTEWEIKKETKELDDLG